MHFIIITGPTATGKSSLAIDIAREYYLPIISADSRQVFKEMSIGIAKPSIEERQGVPHIWMDVKSIKDKISAGIFTAEIKDYLDKEKPPCVIVCGGTQFYIESLLYGLDEMPEISGKTKEAINKGIEKHGLSYLQSEVKKLDPEFYSSSDSENPRRLQRALELMLETGKPYSHFHTLEKKPAAQYPHISFFLTRPREELYARINARVDNMMEAGLLEEARNLYPEKENLNLRTVGYQEFFEYFDGNLSLEEAIALVKQNSRRYAKRQITWYRGNRFRYLARNISNTGLIHREIQLFLLKHRIQ